MGSNPTATARGRPRTFAVRALADDVTHAHCGQARSLRRGVDRYWATATAPDSVLKQHGMKSVDTQKIRQRTLTKLSHVSGRDPCMRIKVRPRLTRRLVSALRMIFISAKWSPGHLPPSWEGLAMPFKVPHAYCKPCCAARTGMSHVPRCGAKQGHSRVDTDTCQSGR